MRILAIFTVAFSTAVFASNYIIPNKILAPLALVLLLCAAVMRLVAKERKRTLLILLGASLGFCCFSLHSLCFVSPAKELDGAEMIIEVKCTQALQAGEDYSYFEGRMSTDSYPGLGIRVYDRTGALTEILPGQVLRFNGKLKAADSRYGEKYDYHHANGIFLTANIEELLSISGKPGAANLLCQLRAWFRGCVDSVFPEKNKAFMLSLMTGDKSLLYEDEGLYTAMSRAGIMHIVAVSGMHIAFLVGFMQLVFGKGRFSCIGCLMLVWLFVVFTGGSYSAVRAAFMQSIVLSAPLLRRESDGITSLSLALAVILFFNPFAAASISLQLSFAAVAGILLLGSNEKNEAKEQGGLGKFYGYVRGSLVCSFGALVFTVPLMAVHFGMVSILAPISNILVLWAVSLCFCIGYLACISSLIFKPLAMLLASISGHLASFICLCARLISGLRFAAVYLDSRMMIIWLLFLYFMLGFALVYKDRRPLRILISLSSAFLALALLLTATNLRYSLGPGCFGIIDVGQGQCVAVMNGENTVVVDCGGINTADNAGETAGGYLLGRGRTSVDVLLLTHLHSDHANGVAMLMEHVKVSKIIMPANADDEDGLLDEILSAATKHGVSVEYLNDDAVIEVGGIVMQLFAPPEDGSKNERCICAHISIDDYDCLITADSPKSRELQLIEDYDLSGTELFIAGHHGSRHSSTGALLEQLQGEVAVISCGYNNFGHPTYEVLERLDAYGYNIFRTDLNSTVEIWVA